MKRKTTLTLSECKFDQYNKEEEEGERIEKKSHSFMDTYYYHDDMRDKMNKYLQNKNHDDMRQ